MKARSRVLVGIGVVVACFAATIVMWIWLAEHLSDQWPPATSSREGISPQAR